MLRNGPKPEYFSVQTISIDSHISASAIHGYVDASTAGLVLGEIIEQLSNRPDTFVLDLTEVTFFGAAGLRLLTEGQAAADLFGTRFAVVVPEKGCVHRVLAISGMIELLDLHVNLYSAMYAKYTN